MVQPGSQKTDPHILIYIFLNCRPRLATLASTEELGRSVQETESLAARGAQICQTLG